MLLCLIILIAVLIRAIPAWDIVFPDNGDVRLFDTDSYYHLRHARFSEANLLAVKRWDHATEYPTGEWASTPGLYDILAGLSAALSGVNLARVLAFTPLILVIGVFLALFQIASRVSGRAAGLTACLLLLLFPGEFLYRSVLGVADHHALEVLLAICTLGGILRALGRQAQGGDARWWIPDAISPLPLALYQLSWVGAPLHIVVASLSLLSAALASLLLAKSTRGIAIVCSRYGIGLSLLLWTIRLALPNLIMAPDYYPAALGISAAMVLVLAPALHMVGRFSDITRQPRLIAASAIACVVIAIGVAGIPEIIQLWSRITLSDSLPPSIFGEKPAVVRETLPTGIGDFVGSFGTMGLLGLAAIPASLWSFWKKRDQAQRVVCGVSGSLLILLWLKTNDYGYLVAPMACLLASVTLEVILDWSGRARVRTRVIGVVLWLSVLVPLFPMGRVRGPSPDPSTLRSMMILDDSWKDAMDWVREATPTPTLSVDEAVHRPASGDTTYPAGTYGVWAAWDYGSFVSSLGLRPVTRSQGPKSANSRWLFHQNELESIYHLDQGASGDERVRYVIVDAATMAQNYPAHLLVAGKSPASVVGPVESLPSQNGTTILPTYGRQDRTAIASRLFFYDGNGLQRYRLVYSSPRRSLIAYIRQESRDPGSLVFYRRAFPDRVPGRSAELDEVFTRLSQEKLPTFVEGLGIVYETIARPSLQVFEVVRGVTITGISTDEAHVRVSIPLRTYPDQRDLVFQAVGQVGSDDRFSVIVPYSTERGPRVPSRAGVTATAECLVELLRGSATEAGRSWRLEISEAQVQSGETIEVR